MRVKARDGASVNQSSYTCLSACLSDRKRERDGDCCLSGYCFVFAFALYFTIRQNPQTIVCELDVRARAERSVTAVIVLIFTYYCC